MSRWLFFLYYQNPPTKNMKKFCISKETIAKPSNTVSWLSVRWLLLYRISLNFSTFNGQVNFMFRRSTLDKCPSNGWVKHKKIPWDTNPYHWYATRVIEWQRKHFCNLQNNVIHPHLFNSFPPNFEFLLWYRFIG